MESVRLKAKRTTYKHWSIVVKIEFQSGMDKNSNTAIQTYFNWTIKWMGDEWYESGFS